MAIVLKSKNQKTNSIVNRMPISTGNLSPNSGVFMSIIFIAIGGYISGIALKLLPFNGRITAPREIVLAAAVVFILAGISFLAQSLKGLLKRNRLKRKKSRSFNSPWNWDFDWNRSGISPRSNNTIFGHIIGILITSLFLAITYWIGFIDKSGFKIPFYGICFFSLFILFWFYTMLSKRIKYGKAQLKFGRFPFYTNKQIDLTFLNLPPRSSTSKVIVNLRYYSERLSKDSKNRTRISLIEEYIQTEVYEASSINSMRQLNCKFKLPDSINYSSQLSEMPASFWEVEIECDIKGWNYREYFLLPIYKV